MTIITASFKFAVPMGANFTARALAYYQQHLLPSMAGRAQVKIGITCGVIRVNLNMPGDCDMQVLDQELLSGMSLFLGSPVEHDYAIETIPSSRDTHYQQAADYS